MHAKHKQLKTLRAQGARLVTTLHDRGRQLFGHADVEDITGLQPKSARNLVAGLVRRGIATRLKPGLFVLVPGELGYEREYLGNPYVVARELVNTRDYYVSHASAMDVHRMATQPQLAVFVTSPKAVRRRTVLGTEFRFVRSKPEHMFGITEHWATKTEKVRVSDLARTVVDGLKHSEHCGGFTEVAKGFWMRRDDIDRKLAFRGRTRETTAVDMDKMEGRYRKLWNARLGSQMASLPPFDNVFRAARRKIRLAGLLDY